MELIEQFVLTILMIYIGYKKAIKFATRIQQRAAVLEQQQKIEDCLKKAEKESFLGNFSPPPRLSVDIPWPEDIHEGEARILKRTSLKRESICDYVIEESCDEPEVEGCGRQNETIVEDEGSGGIKDEEGEECRERRGEEYKKRYGKKCGGEWGVESSNTLRGECSDKLKEGCDDKLEEICDNKLEEICNDKLEEKLANIGPNLEQCEETKKIYKKQFMEESEKVSEEECGKKPERDLEESNEQCNKEISKDEATNQDYKDGNYYCENVGGSNTLVTEVKHHREFVKDSEKEVQQEEVKTNKRDIVEKSQNDSGSCLPILKKDHSNQDLLVEINTDSGSQIQDKIIPRSCVEPRVELGKQQRDEKESEECRTEDLPTNKEDVLHVILRVDSNQKNDETLKSLEKDIKQSTHNVTSGNVDALKDEASKNQKAVSNEDLITDEDRESETASFGTDETATIGDDEFYSLCLPHDGEPHLSHEASREISPSPQKTQTKKSTLECTSRNTQESTASKSVTNTDVTSKDDNTVYLCSAKVRKEGLDPDCQVILKNNEVVIGNCDITPSPGHPVTSQQKNPQDQNGSDDEDDSAFHSAISDVDKNSRVRKNVSTFSEVDYPKMSTITPTKVSRMKPDIEQDMSVIF